MLCILIGETFTMTSLVSGNSSESVLQLLIGRTFTMTSLVSGNSFVSDRPPPCDGHDFLGCGSYVCRRHSCSGRVQPSSGTDPSRHLWLGGQQSRVQRWQQQQLLSSSGHPSIHCCLLLHRPLLCHCSVPAGNIRTFFQGCNTDASY